MFRASTLIKSVVLRRQYLLARRRSHVDRAEGPDQQRAAGSHLSRAVCLGAASSLSPGRWAVPCALYLSTWLDSNATNARIGTPCRPVKATTPRYHIFRVVHSRLGLHSLRWKSDRRRNPAHMPLAVRASCDLQDRRAAQYGDSGQGGREQDEGDTRSALPEVNPVAGLGPLLFGGSRRVEL